MNTASHAKFTFLLRMCALLLVPGFVGRPATAQAQGFKFLEVTVVDADGKPLADVPVEIRIDGTEFPMPTGPDGRVAVNVPAADNSDVEIRVRQEGYTAMAVGWRGGQKIPEKVTIPLTKGVSFGGIVHDEEGRPVEGVKISGEMVFENRHGLVHDGEVAPCLDGDLAKTDKDGKWQCPMAPEGNAEFELNFSHPEYLNTLAEYNVNGPSWEVLKSLKEVVVLKDGVVLTGTVVDPDGQPIPRAFVEAMAGVDGNLRGSQTFSDREGKFQTHPIPIGKTTLSVVADGLAPLRMKIESANTEKPLTLRLDKGRSIQIRVVNRVGQPLAKARVSITDWHYPGNQLDIGDHYFADEQGEWKWDLAPDEEVTYLISAQGYREAKHKLVARSDLQTVTLEPAVKIVGNVIDKETREPIRKFQLMQIASLDCGEGCNSLIAYGATELITPGDYVFETGLLCKEFHLSCSANGYKSSNTRAISPDEDLVQWDFEMEREVPESKGN